MRSITLLTGLAAFTTAAVQAQQVCNNYPEFCNRSYANVTEICTHNSMFNVPGWVFSNQRRSVSTQLDKGIRFLTGQVHNIHNGDLHFCHTKCGYLDAGPVSNFFNEVGSWLSRHPNEVLSIVLVNSDDVPPSMFVPSLTAAGLAQLAYSPPKWPMALADWPTLGEMIAMGKRVVIFIDSKADRNSVPYILDQFSNLWETPFDPTDKSFPCTLDRPSWMTPATARNTMYMVNHNLNAHLKLGAIDVLVPDTLNLGATNAVDGPSGLQANVDRCGGQWGHKPKAMLVDYFDQGSGSVFEAAARANGVHYTNYGCC